MFVSHLQSQDCVWTPEILVLFCFILFLAQTQLEDGEEQFAEFDKRCMSLEPWTVSSIGLHIKSRTRLDITAIYFYADKCKETFYWRKQKCMCEQCGKKLHSETNHVWNKIGWLEHYLIIKLRLSLLYGSFMTCFSQNMIGLSFVLEPMSVILFLGYVSNDLSAKAFDTGIINKTSIILWIFV